MHRHALLTRMSVHALVRAGGDWPDMVVARMTIRDNRIRHNPAVAHRGDIGVVEAILPDHGRRGLLQVSFRDNTGRWRLPMLIDPIDVSPLHQDDAALRATAA